MNNRLKFFMLVASTAAAVGIAYTILAFTNVPEDFDWEEDDE